MRELPLSVWKARRTVVISPRSSGCCASRDTAARALSMTSRASSMKISRISASSSSPVCPGAATRAGGTGAGGGRASGGGGAKAAMVCASSSRTAWRAVASVAWSSAVCALLIARARAGCSAAAAWRDRRSSSSASTASGTCACTRVCAWSSSAGVSATGSGVSSNAAKAEGFSLCPITALRLPVSGS